ncbi:MAG: tetratricopeptide repeat protein [Planctomycetia bacterium]
MCRHAGRIAGALLAYERYCRGPTPARYLLVVAAMLGGLLSKATVVALPALLAVLDVWPLGRVRLPGLPAATLTANQPARYSPASWRLACGEKLPLLGLSALFVAVTIATQAETIHAETGLPLFSARVPNAIVATATYLVETAWPYGLHPVHPHPGLAGIRPAAVLASGLGLLSLVALATAVARRVPAVPAGLAWFLLALSPVLGVVKQHGFQARADRFTYLAHVGLFIAITWACARLADIVALPRRWRLAAVVIVAMWFIAIDQRQIALWRNPDTLWSGVLVIEPDNHVAIATQAVGRLNRGDCAGAERGFRRTLALAPHFPEAHYNLGVTLVRQQRYEEAVAAFRAAVHDNPRDAAALANLGGCHARAGRWGEATAELHTAVGLDGSLVSARLNLAACLLETGAAAEALEQARAVLDRQPDNAAARQLAARCTSRSIKPPPGGEPGASGSGTAGSDDARK